MNGRYIWWSCRQQESHRLRGAMRERCWILTGRRLLWVAVSWLLWVAIARLLLLRASNLNVSLLSTWGQTIRG